MRRIPLAVALVAVLLLGWQPSLLEASPILAAPTATQHVGDTFTVAVSVANADGLTSFQFDLGFDPTVVRMLNFTDVGTDFETAATSGGASLTGLTGFALGSPIDLLSGVGDSISGLGNGLTPGGSLVLIQFEALATGVSPLTFSCALCQGAFLIDNGLPLSSQSGDFSAQDGQISVLPSAVPEPAPLILLSTGVAATGLRRRKSRRSTM